MVTADNSAAKTRGLARQLESGETYLALTAAKEVFALTDSLSCVLQSSTLSVSGALYAVNVTLEQLQKMHTEEHFLELWNKAQSKISDWSLSDIKLPRHIRPHRRFDHQPNAGDAHQHESTFDYYRIQYFSFADVVICECVIVSSNLVQ